MADTRLKQLEETQTGIVREMSEHYSAFDGQNTVMQEVLSQIGGDWFTTEGFDD
ncbi:hypothetical protein MTR_0030s0030 [Medicago truncatula]|uniref:Uncharacterized protein n=1 Tax=Medicago truncatula TaxID=3880 RepID=G7ZUF9_MEDTR|nr:hypothetical protein MTR_0030s0030 [Medicago truncatula]